MIDYGCPSCRRKLLEAEAVVPVRIETKCPGCSEIVEPQPYRAEVLQRTYRCSGCGRTQHVERPKNDRTHCLVCGTPTLVVVSEHQVGMKRREPVPVRAR